VQRGDQTRQHVLIVGGEVRHVGHVQRLADRGKLRFSNQVDGPAEARQCRRIAADDGLFETALIPERGTGDNAALIFQKISAFIFALRFAGALSFSSRHGFTITPVFSLLTTHQEKKVEIRAL